MLTYRPFEPTDIATATAIWNAACGANLAITERLVEFNTRATTGVIQAGQVALQEGAVVGFVLASTTQTSAVNSGWVDVIAVLPSAQNNDIGTTLLNWACDWLRKQNCNKARLGGSLRPFIPGLPLEFNNAAFFRRRGFEGEDQDWDVARDLENYLHPHITLPNVEVSPAQPSDIPALQEFFARAFSGRWQFEFEEFLREDGRISDYVVLFAEDSGAKRIEAFCQTTVASSLRPLDRFYPQPLPKPWGQAGPLGVSDACRGKGYASAVVHGGLAHLRAQGVRGCIIDWTDLLDFYAKFGFKPHRGYAMLSKVLAGSRTL